MQLHEIRPTHKVQKAKRIGRGGKKGVYSGRGIKGQKARAGKRLKPLIREFIKRYPKLRGYRYGSSFQSERAGVFVINLDVLEKKFKSDEKVNPESLSQKKIIRKIGRELAKVKILGKGEIKKALTIEGCKISKSAKGKIEKAGGTIK